MHFFSGNFSELKVDKLCTTIDPQKYNREEEEERVGQPETRGKVREVVPVIGALIEDIENEQAPNSKNCLNYEGIPEKWAMLKDDLIENGVRGANIICPKENPGDEDKMEGQ
jgi:hypothetical protein